MNIDGQIVMECACGKCDRRVEVTAIGGKLRIRAMVAGHYMVDLRVKEYQRAELIRILSDGEGDGEAEHDTHTDRFRRDA